MRNVDLIFKVKLTERRFWSFNDEKKNIRQEILLILGCPPLLQSELKI